MRFSRISFLAPFILAATLALPGCSTIEAAWSGGNNYYSGQLKSTVSNIQGTNDNAAATWAEAGCATPYGELVRNGSGNPNMPAAVIALCGAPPGFTLIHTTPTAQAITSVPTFSVSVEQPEPKPAPVPAPAQ